MLSLLSSAVRRCCLFSFLVGASLFVVDSASARKNGVQALDCTGCHGDHVDATFALETGELTLGSTVELLFVVTDPHAVSAGIYIEADAELQTGPGMAAIGSGATHTSPHPFRDGKAEFSVMWSVPLEPGALRFSVAAVAANDDGRKEGDEAVSGTIDVVFGCEPQLFYYDEDGDGYGDDNLAYSRTFCAGAAPFGFSAVGGDCVDYRSTTHPNAMELCNGQDDDCDGEIDEDAVEIELYPDADGDGYYSTKEYLSGDSVFGCVPYEGYASEPGDCDATRPNIHPGAEEVCDGRFDENCNGQIDDRLRPFCGEGSCARQSRSCDVADCTPGQPSVEVCNFFDDDCDGEVDEGDLCPAGQVCAAGRCRSNGEVVSGGEQPSTSSEEEAGPTPSHAVPTSCNVRAIARSPALVGWALLVVLGGLLRRRRLRPEPM